MKAVVALSCVVVVAALLESCSGSALRWTPEYHVVRSGETLYSIAWQYDIDYRTLARWNGLGDGALIRPGQKIRLSGSGSAASSSSASSQSGAPATPAPTLASPAPNWQWPTQGKVALRFGESPKSESGIRITGKKGQPVLAAADGQVVYAGSGLKGYGQLLIVKHNATYLSAYGYNSALLVKEGQNIGRGQQIARMGESSSRESALHFEIRRNGQPVDPLKYLP